MTVRFDPQRLLEWPVPEAKQVLTRRDVALYALSVGFGRDPLDATQLRYVDPWSPDLTPLPSMALAMGYPGFWLGDPALGLDAKRILHVGQSIEILAPLPVEGQVTGRTRVTALVDRGADKGALLFSQRDVSDAHGRPFARLSQTHMLRGIGGFDSFGPQPQAPRRTEPSAACAVIDIPTRPEQALLYRLNGDSNPIHSDPVIAASAGFQAPILHGMCSFALLTKGLVGVLCEDKPERLQTLSMRFTGIVYPGETLRAHVFRDGSFRASIVERNATVIDFGSTALASSQEKAPLPSHAF